MRHNCNAFLCLKFWNAQFNCLTFCQCYLCISYVSCSLFRILFRTLCVVPGRSSHGCCNCIGRSKYFVDDVLVHAFSTDYHRFIKHTQESIATLVIHVGEQVRLNPRSRERFQQSTGFKYHPEGLMWDPLARSRLALPHAGYIDWMHMLVASGGVAQFEVNQLILVLRDHQIDVEHIDDWCEAVVKPAGFTKLKASFFASRVVDKRSAHIRAFASEMLSAIVLLDMFLHVVVSPMENVALEANIACLTLLVCIITILQKGDINDLAKLRLAMHSHHILFQQCYPACVKPKVHAGQHIADSWAFWKRLVACFSPERNHKGMKQVMRFAFNRATKTSLAYAIRDWFTSLAREHAFSPTHFVGSVYAVNGCDSFVLPHHGVCVITHWCTKLRVPIGLLGKDDLIRYRSLGGVLELGFAIGFARLQLSASILFVVVLQVCKPAMKTASGLQLWRRCDDHGIVASAQLNNAVPYVDCGESFGARMFVPATHQ